MVLVEHGPQNAASKQEEHDEEEDEHRQVG
jgi:hypothetical protein